MAENLLTGEFVTFIPHGGLPVSIVHYGGVYVRVTRYGGKQVTYVPYGGTPITIVATADERDEAEWVARELRERCASEHYAYGDAAVLYRTNAQSRAFEDAFRRSAIPHRVIGAVSFYERREVKDLIAYLRLIVNPQDDEAFLRSVQVPRRGIGLGSLHVLQETATQWHRPLLETAAIADRIPGLRPAAKESFQHFAGLIERLRATLPESSPAALLEQLIAPALRSRNAERRAAGLNDLQALTDLAQELGGLLLWREVREMAAT